MRIFIDITRKLVRLTLTKRNKSMGLTMKQFLMATTAVALLSGAAQAADDAFADRMLGDVGGKRSALLDAGVDVSLGYRGDVWHTSGGIKDGYNYNDQFDLGFDLDGEKLLGLKGTTASISFIANNGSDINASRIGSTQGVNNTETAPNTAKLYEAFVEQSYADDKVAVLFGLRDLNAEFYVNDMAGNFILTAMGIGQTFAQSGVNGPSVFPNTALAGRVKVKPTDVTYVSVAAFDGVAGDPAHAHGTHQKLKSDDGLLLVGEVGYVPAAQGTVDELNKVAIGAWSYTKQFDDLTAVDSAGSPVKHRQQGLYILASDQFYYNKEKGQSAGVFFRTGFADADTAQVDVSYESGIVAKGFVPSRPEGEFGLGVSVAHQGDKARNINGFASEKESQVEFYYKDELCQGVSIQPDVQYVTDMLDDKNIDSAVVVGARLSVDF